MAKKTTIFGLVRHAETRWNQEKRIQGIRDAPLTEAGIYAAKSWGARLRPFNWDLIVSSDLDRTIQTAGYINRNLDLPFTTEIGLREQDWGQWTGKYLPELEADPDCNIAEKTAMGWLFQPPGGESREAVWKRASRALKGIRNEHQDKRVLVITHEGVIKTVLCRLLNRKFLTDEPRVLKKDRHLHLLSCGGEGLRIKQINALAL